MYQVVDYSNPREPIVLKTFKNYDNAVKYCEKANEACYHAFVEEV